MSDKRIYKKDKDFENQGWKNMSSILDQEMPVKKKKRSFFLLFFLVGIASCGGALWTGYQSMDLSSPISEAMKPNGPLDRTETKILRPENLTNESKTFKETIIDSQKDIETATTTKATTIDIKTTTIGVIKDNKRFIRSNNHMQSYNQNYTSQTLQNKFLIENNSEGNETTVLEVIQGRESIDLPLEKLNESKENTSEDIKEILEIESVKKEQINDIELEPIASLQTKPFEYTKEKELPNLLSKEKYWKFGLETGFVFQNANEMGGKLGFVATRQFNQKWALHTGLDYQIQFVNYTEAEQTRSLNAELEDLGTLGSPITDESEELRNSVTKFNSRFIKIPILVGYKFNRSFEITTGLIGSALTSTRNPALEDDPLSAFNDEEYTSPKKITPVYDLQASIGLTYYPSSKFGISLRYDNGFFQRKLTVKSENDIPLPTVNFVGYNSKYRQLSLSTRIYF